MSSAEKKHYWLVSYIGRGAYGNGSVHGSITFFSDKSYFNMSAYKHVQQSIPDGCVIISVNYLGEMTEKEWSND